MTLPDGRLVEGVDVGIEETTERWTEVKLGDGTTLRAKLSPVQVLRAESEYDPNGMPMYNVNFAILVAVVDAPDKLKKKVK